MNNSDGFNPAATGGNRFGKTLYKNRFFEKKLERKLDELDKLWTKRERALDWRKYEFDLSRRLKCEELQKKFQKNGSEGQEKSINETKETNKPLINNLKVNNSLVPVSTNLASPSRGSYTANYHRQKLETTLRTLKQTLPKIITTPVTTPTPPVKSSSSGGGELFSRKKISNAGLNITKVECVPKKTYEQNFSFINTIKIAKSIYEFSTVSSTSTTSTSSSTTTMTKLHEKIMTTTTTSNESNTAVVDDLASSTDLMIINPKLTDTSMTLVSQPQQQSLNEFAMTSKEQNTINFSIRSSIC